MNERAHLAALGGRMLAAGDHIAPLGDEPTKPGIAGHVRSAEDGVYVVSWFGEDGQFARHQVGRLLEVMDGCQRIPGPRPLAPRPSDPQPGDVRRETSPTFGASPSAGNLFEPSMDGVPPVLPRWKSYR